MTEGLQRGNTAGGEIIPVLARLYNVQQKSDSQVNKTPETQNELTSLVSNLLSMELSVRESELVADVLITLMRQVEKDMCIALSERLSTMEAVPLRLLLHISSEEIDIAAPVLRHSPVFNDMDLIYIIKSKPAEYWREIAKRAEMGEAVIDALVDADDLDTAIHLAENKKIGLTQHAVDVLINMAQDHDDIAKPLIHRSDLSADVVRTLYQGVSVAMRHYIRQNFDNIQNDVTDQVKSIAEEFVEASRVENQGKGLIEVIPGQSHYNMARRLQEKEMLNSYSLIKAIRRGQYQTFLAQFVTLFDLTLEMAQSILVQVSGQGLAILCRYKRITREDFVSLYLLMSRARDKGKMLNSKDLIKASQYYDKIDFETANTLYKTKLKKQDE